MISWLNPELTDLASLARRLALGIPHAFLPSSGVISRLLHPTGISISAGDSNSGPHICMPSTVPTNPSPQPPPTPWSASLETVAGYDWSPLRSRTPVTAQSSDILRSQGVNPVCLYFTD